ncbi:methyl-coenzyme M reductase subunit D [Methanomicrobium sp. W14]|uniref:methyl-coenzyme M reductase operon protein D n=1 Tax=Methanomicrobium sp. W14 TaxID=2817839 RepID=UPI001AE72CE6|nr:methyl-coenzyme M reductase operon protein D [Methanomicrobium sp. W14]MBP2134004.1 methyl-coenzyme M reductase subunit D [Methanomicrobium sp. W14]
MTQSQYPQCRAVPLRMLSPETAEKYLNEVVKVPGIRRMMINGPSLPAVVPYGPARGKPNPNSNRKAISVGTSEVDLRVQVGMVIFEVEDKTVIEEIRGVSTDFFKDHNILCQVQEGKFMKTSPTLVDYCKYGPEADESVIGLVDPRKKDGPVIIQGRK